MRLNMFVLLCAVVLITAGALHVASVGDAYADGGVQPRDDRSDCNGNGVADAIELGPLAGHALLFDGEDDYVNPGASAARRGFVRLIRGTPS